VLPSKAVCLFLFHGLCLWSPWEDPVPNGVCVRVRVLWAVRDRLIRVRLVECVGVLVLLLVHARCLEVLV
jgi:hypothetical protein